MNNYKVSIIIPVYKVEKFIERCAVSLFKQTLDSIQYIFINDCTPDKSIEILEETLNKFPTRVQDVMILHNIENKGSAETRNIGIKKAEGDYITFVDADDWLDCDGIEKMYNFIHSKNLDIVYNDVYYYNLKRDGKEVRLDQNFGDDNITCLKAMMGGLDGKKFMQGYLWNKMFNRQFLYDSNQWLLPEVNCNEDLGLNLKLFALTKKIGYSKDIIYYHYHFTPSKTSITHNRIYDSSVVYRKASEGIMNIESAIDFLKEQKLDEKLELSFIECKIRFKNHFFSPSKVCLKKWYDLYSDLNTVAIKKKRQNSGFFVKIATYCVEIGFWQGYVFLGRLKHMFTNRRFSNKGI